MKIERPWLGGCVFVVRRRTSWWQIFSGYPVSRPASPACGRRCRSWNRVPGKNLSPRRTTDDARTKKHPPNRGRSIFILVLFYRFWTHVKFFRGSRKRFSTNCLLFRMINRDSQISSFESYTLLRRIQNENQLDVDIQFFVAWVSFLCSKRMISFFNSIGPRSRTSQF